MNDDIETNEPAPAQFTTLHSDETSGGPDLNLDVILDVPVTLSLEVGRARLPIRNLLQLNQGSVVELERGAANRTSRNPPSNPCKAPPCK